MELNTGVLQGIANPMIADVGGAFQQGQEQRQGRQFDETAKAVISNTPGSKFADLMKLDPMRATQFADAFGIPKNETDRLKNAVGTIGLANKFLMGGTSPKEVGAYLLEQAQLLGEQGFATQQLERAGNAFLSGDPQIIAQEQDAFAQLAAQFETAGGDADASDIRKELRGGLRKNFDSIIKEESAITTNYKKIQGLLGEVGKGNRTAVAQSIVSLVKLGDPGSTVSGQEMVAALNNQDPTGAFTNLILSTGASEEVKQAILNSFDPLNPNTFSVDNFQATADRVLESQVGSIQSRFNDFSTQGRSNLSQQGLDSVLPKGLQSRIDKLSDLMVKRENSAPPPAITSQIDTLRARAEALRAEIAAEEAK